MDVLKFPILFLWLLNVTGAAAQDSLNMVRLARWDDDSLPIAAPGSLRVQYNACWGMALKGREYAVLGGARHVLFFDVTQPTKPKLIGKFEGTDDLVVREFKSYKGRIYAVSDGPTEEGLMIFDMSQAPDTIIRTYWSNEHFHRSHTISLDTLSGRIYLNGTDVVQDGLLVLDVSQNPDKPVFRSAKSLPGGYVHDCYVRNDTVYASCGFNGYYIYDYTDFDNHTLVTSLPPTGGYQHSSWLTLDGRYAYCAEEIPQGRPILIVDVQDLANANIEVAGSFLHPQLPPLGGNAIPHNIYIRGHLLFDSQYEDGLLAYDISNPTAPQLIARYDTHPENTQYNGYFGCWGNYPWLPSGTIVAGDMQNGLQLLKILNPSSATQDMVGKPSFSLSPNPAHSDLSVRVSGEKSFDEKWRVRLISTAGESVLERECPAKTQEVVLPVALLSAGMYWVEIRTESGRQWIVKRVVVK